MDEAIATVKQALATDPEIVEGYMLLGNFYKKMKRPQDAIAAYRDALARDNEHQNALFSLALAYKDEGRLDEARVGFERARELDPRNGKVLWQLADLWMRKGDSARAEAVITDALERKVDEQRLLLKLGESRIEAKRFDEAERALKAALEKKPGLALAQFDLGLVYEGQGQIDKAIESYEAELSTNPRRTARRSTPRSCCRRSAAAERRSRISAKWSRSNRRSARASSISPRRCWTPAISAGAEQWARAGLKNKPEPRMAPLGHYVLADVYEQRGNAADAKREVEMANRLKRGS